MPFPSDSCAGSRSVSRDGFAGPAQQIARSDEMEFGLGGTVQAAMVGFRRV
jgi:hypothetical protein